jgi:aldose 1-epimerase
MKFAPLAARCLLAACLPLASCSTVADQPSPSSTAVSASVIDRPFGKRLDGRTARLWTVRGHGLEFDVSDHGATLVAVRAIDRGGKVDDVVLGFDDVAGYESADNQYFGCTTGRVCNRIANAEFALDGRSYALLANDGRNHLHGGGDRALSRLLWNGKAVRDGGNVGVRFTVRSADGDEGYPGNLDVAVTYWLQPGPAIHVVSEASSDRRTPINLTNHAYWNLAGAGAATVLDHQLQITADQYTPTNDSLIPTGALAPVAGTPLDFRTPVALSLWFDGVAGTPAKGYDHNLVLRGGVGSLRPVARLWHPETQRSLRIETTEPGLQVYTGNYLKNQVGKGGRRYPQNSAVCLETQHFPDSVHHKNFPTTILEPGTPWRSETRFVLQVADSVTARSL